MGPEGFVERIIPVKFQQGNTTWLPSNSSNNTYDPCCIERIVPIKISPMPHYYYNDYYCSRTMPFFRSYSDGNEIQRISVLRTLPGMVSSDNNNHESCLIRVIPEIQVTIIPFSQLIICVVCLFLLASSNYLSKD